MITLAQSMMIVFIPDDEGDNGVVAESHILGPLYLHRLNAKEVYDG